MNSRMEITSVSSILISVKHKKSYLLQQSTKSGYFELVFKPQTFNVANCNVLLETDLSCKLFLDLQWHRRFFCQRKRFKNDTKTVHKRRFFETPLPFFKTSRRLANEIIAGIAV